VGYGACAAVYEPLCLVELAHSTYRHTSEGRKDNTQEWVPQNRNLLSTSCQDVPISWRHQLLLTLIVGEMAEVACPSDTPNNSTAWICGTKSGELGGLLKEGNGRCPSGHAYHQKLVSICIGAQRSLPQSHRPNLKSWVNREITGPIRRYLETHKKSPEQCTAYNVIRYL